MTAAGMWHRLGGGVVLAVAACALAGCVSAALAPRIVTAPSLATRSGAAQPSLAGGHPEARVALAQLYARTLRVPVAGPPAAEIALGVIEPGDYHHDYGFAVRPGATATAKPQYVVSARWDPLPGDDHYTLSMRLDGLAHEVVGWFDGALLESGGP